MVRQAHVRYLRAKTNLWPIIESKSFLPRLRWQASAAVEFYAPIVKSPKWECALHLWIQLAITRGFNLPPLKRHVCKKLELVTIGNQRYHIFSFHLFMLGSTHGVANIWAWRAGIFEDLHLTTQNSYVQARSGHKRRRQKRLAL